MNNDSKHILLMQLLAATKSEKDIIDEAIKALKKYKKAGFPKDEQPHQQLAMVFMKWDTNGMDLPEVIDKTKNKLKAFEEMREIMKETPSKEEKENIILSGPHGKA